MKEVEKFLDLSYAGHDLEVEEWNDWLLRLNNRSLEDKAKGSWPLQRLQRLVVEQQNN